MSSLPYQYSNTVKLTPYWTSNKPNVILVITYYTTSGYEYSATISNGKAPQGGGLNQPVTFPSNSSGVSVNTLTLPNYQSGQTLSYTINISSNSPKLSMAVQNSTPFGVKPNGDTLTYQGAFFSNDAGSDNDWNDCVISFALYNDSTD
jgi:hypothetical protein